MRGCVGFGGEGEVVVGGVVSSVFGLLGFRGSVVMTELLCLVALHPERLFFGLRRRIFSMCEKAPSVDSL